MSTGREYPADIGPRGLYPAQRKDRGPIEHDSVVGDSFRQRGGHVNAGSLVYEKGERGQQQ